jgi:hypothetical protein
MTLNDLGPNFIDYCIKPDRLGERRQQEKVATAVGIQEPE